MSLKSKALLQAMNCPKTMREHNKSTFIDVQREITNAYEEVILEYILAWR
jgi:hypothetical protein